MYKFIVPHVMLGGLFKSCGWTILILKAKNRRVHLILCHQYLKRCGSRISVIIYIYIYILLVKYN